IQLLQKSEAETIIKKFLNSRSQEATLPPQLDRKTVDAIPAKPGVYYFLDQKKTIIYVGKAKNLKKRVLGHFYDKSEHEIRLCREVAHINFELSGSELIALLMESAAIKAHFPKFNRAQKKSTARYGIFSYEDRNGILHLGFANTKQVPRPLAIFGNPTDCRLFLRRLCNDFSLCPKYCQLLPEPSLTTSCQGNLCRGICRDDENIPTYNLRVKEAQASLTISNEEVILKQKGRHPQEEAFIWIENGSYRGYGFIDAQQEVRSKEDLKAFLIPQRDTLETQRIVNNAILRHESRILFP
ncbi:MAG: GIY-YIG nuclease family protein, partial [Bacteroidota bacterium]